jgi:hypothetical protein
MYDHCFVYCGSCWWASLAPGPEEARCPLCNSQLTADPYQAMAGMPFPSHAARPGVLQLTCTITIDSERHCRPCVTVQGRADTYTWKDAAELSLRAAIAAGRQLACFAAAGHPYDLQFFLVQHTDRQNTPQRSGGAA